MQDRKSDGKSDGKTDGKTDKKLGKVRGTLRRPALLWAAVVLVAFVGGGALVYASVPHTFATGETLSADNLNGNFTALDQRLATLEALLPAGTIIAFGGPAGAAVVDAGAGGGAPAGWLLCDGSAVSRTTYATLFGAIGINFGGGDGIATFNLPDLRGRFLRGADRGAGRDPNAAARVASNPGGPLGDAVGTLQADQFASHQHALNDPGHAHSSPTTNGVAGTRELPGATSSGFDYVDSGGASAPVSTSTTGITEALAGGGETRPKNVAVNYIIKL
jgi:microcystin-dependent protein